jgi:hypothetical protein
MNDARSLIPVGGGFSMLPAAPGTCEVCATAHAPAQPHNQQSMFYQYRFFAEHKRWPTWADAMSHCDETTKAFWKSELAKRGVQC